MQCCDSANFTRGTGENAKSEPVVFIFGGSFPIYYPLQKAVCNHPPREAEEGGETWSTILSLTFQRRRSSTVCVSRTSGPRLPPNAQREYGSKSFRVRASSKLASRYANAHAGAYAQARRAVHTVAHTHAHTRRDIHILHCNRAQLGRATALIVSSFETVTSRRLPEIPRDRRENKPRGFARREIRIRRRIRQKGPWKTNLPECRLLHSSLSPSTTFLSCPSFGGYR